MRLYDPDSIYSLDRGPWAYDFVTNTWVTLDGRLATVGWLDAKSRYRPAKWRRSSLHSTGYMSIGGPLVHQVVARAWIYKPHPNYIVNHKDGNKTNNHAYNLEWISHKGNLKHAYDTGLRSVKRTPELIEAISSALSTNQRYWGASAIASEFGVHLSLVKTIALEIRNGN